MRNIYYSTVFEAPVEDVWQLLRDFNGWAAWLGPVNGSAIEDARPSDSVGCVRVLDVEGGPARERLLGLSDHSHTLTYSVEDAPIPMTDYVATVRLLPVTDGERTFAEWSGSFSAAPEQEAEIGDAIRSTVYEGGFAGLRKLLSER
jgi:uncharacterized protein YndB with AHSA1/START domain